MPCVPIKDKKTVDQMMEVLASRPNGFVYSMYFEFALSTALRVSDILSLKKRDIINGVVYVKTQKTGVVKHIALNDKCRAKMDINHRFVDKKELNFIVRVIGYARVSTDEQTLLLNALSHFHE